MDPKDIVRKTGSVSAAAAALLAAFPSVSAARASVTVQPGVAMQKTAQAPTVSKLVLSSPSVARLRIADHSSHSSHSSHYSHTSSSLPSDGTGHASHSSHYSHTSGF